MTDTHSPIFKMLPRRHAVLRRLFLCSWMAGAILRLAAADSAVAQDAAASPPATNATAAVESNAAPRFNVAAYAVKGHSLPSTNALNSLFSKHTGTNVSLEEIVKAAADLQSEYRRQGCPAMSVAIARERITNGIVTLNVFQTAVPQIVVSGKRYLSFTNGLAMVTNPPAASPVIAQMPPAAPAAAVAATPITPPVISHPRTPATPKEMARARAALFQAMTEVEAKEKDTRIHVVSTNAGPRFEVDKYLITGNSALPPEVMAGVLTNIDGAFGTNVSFEGIRAAVAELQGAYRERGYVTVAVALPQQKLTNATVKVQVTEGRLAAINVTGNHYFSSNNVMRALPSLHTNWLLNGPIFQAELNQANANQDRQIYPVLGPGPEPGTSDLTLKVKDQLPLHAKVEFNNQNSPGTPDLRVNGSAVFDNLWQLNQTLGVQYGFSPEQYKEGKQWQFYDQPLVANYSAFYRLPLGNPKPIEDMIANNPDNFGYNEATRKFNLPPPTGQPDLTFFVSRATIDTGLTIPPNNIIGATRGTNFDGTIVTNTTLAESSPHQDLTVNSDIGSRLSLPLQTSPNFQSVLSGGFDFKSYKDSSAETNIFTVNTAEINYDFNPPTTNNTTSITHSPVPFTVEHMEYLPLMLHYDANWRDARGTAAFGLGISANVWFFSETSFASSSNNVAHTTYLHGAASLQQITGSRESSGYWVTVNPSFSRTFMLYTNWITSFRADGQWTSEPLISNEQFGIGGVNSVRGYHEGEVFGDTGWHVSLEQQTPPHVVGIVYGNTPLTVRGSAYMDYAKIYLLDPQGRPNDAALWGTGLGLAASIGSHWEARFLFSVPLISTSITPRDQPYFNFSLTAQF